MHFSAEFMALKDILQAVTPKDHNGFVFREKCLEYELPYILYKFLHFKSRNKLLFLADIY